MKKLLRATFCLMMILITTSTSAQDLLTYFSINEMFESSVAEKRLSKSMPLLSEPDSRFLIEQLSNIKILDTRVLTKDDLGLIVDLCGKANANVMSYVMFDLENRVDIKAKPSELALQVKDAMNRNIRNYQNELSYLQPFSIQCFAKQAPLIAEFTAKLPADQLTEVRKAGIRQLRNGAANMFAGLLQVISDVEFGERYQEAILAALSKTAKDFSSLISLSVRIEIAESVKTTIMKTKQSMHPYLEKIGDAMAVNSCVGLCAVE